MTSFIFAAVDPGIDECSQTDFGDFAGLAACHGAVELGELSLRDAVCKNLVLRNEFHHLRLQAPVSSDDAAEHPFVCKVLDTSVPVALSAGVDEGEPVRMALCEKAVFNRFQDRFGSRYQRHSDGGDGAVVADHHGRFASGQKCGFFI